MTRPLRVDGAGAVSERLAVRIWFHWQGAPVYDDLGPFDRYLAELVCVSKSGALARAGLPPMRWHALRASCATLLIEMGTDLETARRILGHRDIATTVRYIGQTPAALRGAADKITEAMG